MRRIFIGIKISLSPESQQVLSRLKIELRDEPIRWEVPEKLHITLCFIGSVLPGQLETVCEILQQVSQEQAVFSFLLKNLSCFKRRGEPAVVFFDVAKGDELVGLAGQIKNRLNTTGISTNPGFNPHVTLARLKKLKNKPAFYAVMDQMRETPAQIVDVQKIMLYESVLKPVGSEYKILYEFNFS